MLLSPPSRRPPLTPPPWSSRRPPAASMLRRRRVATMDSMLRVATMMDSTPPIVETGGMSWARVVARPPVARCVRICPTFFSSAVERQCISLREMAR
ncbi:unnamed protein product, partial [Ectocarpus sp. 8 AP-2014]